MGGTSPYAPVGWQEFAGQPQIVRTPAGGVTEHGLLSAGPFGPASAESIAIHDPVAERWNRV